MFLFRFMRQRHKCDADPVPSEAKMLLFQTGFPVIDVGQNVEVTRVADKEMPPTVELWKWSEHWWRCDTKPLKWVAEIIVQNPEEECDKVPGGENEK